MHGTGLCTAIQALGNGGAVVTLPSRSLDPEALWGSVEARRANVIAIVGDPKNHATREMIARLKRD